MKNVIATLLLLAATPAKAESHGMVASSNAGFQAVTEYALNQGGTLFRVLAVKKMSNVYCGDKEMYKITIGGMDSDGVERSEGENFVLVDVTWGNDGPVGQVTPLSKPKCDAVVPEELR